MSCNCKKKSRKMKGCFKRLQHAIWLLSEVNWAMREWYINGNHEARDHARESARHLHNLLIGNYED